MQAKKPGLELSAHTVTMDTVDEEDPDHKLDAYEAMILNAIIGDRALFLRADEVDLAWQVVDPIIEKWAKEQDFVDTYPAGTWGPEQVTRILENDCHQWRNNL